MTWEHCRTFVTTFADVMSVFFYSEIAALLQRVRTPLLEIMPLVFILFFCFAGANMKLSAIPDLGSIGAVYILGRSTGLIGGGRLGASFGRVEEKVKKYVALGILSQAGVAIGLSLSAEKHLFGRYPCARIDHVFVDPGIEVVAMEVPNTELTRVASDHLPLIADVRIPQPSIPPG